MSPRKSNFQERGSLESEDWAYYEPLTLQLFTPLDSQVNCNLTAKVPVAMTTKFLTPHQGTPRGLYSTCWCADGVTQCPSTSKLDGITASSGTSAWDAKLSLRLLF